MALNSGTRDSLKSLVLNDGPLQSELVSAGSLAQAAGILAEVARHRGLHVTADEILSDGSAVAEGNLSDEQLEAVSAGSWFGDVLGTILNVVGGVPYVVGVGIGELGRKAGEL